MNKSLKSLICLALFVAVLNSTMIIAAEKKLSLAMPEKVVAQKFKKDGDFLQAAKHFELAVQLGLSAEYGLWNSVDSLIRANEPGLALQPLRVLAEEGNSQIEYFESLVDHYMDANSQEFSEIITRVRQNIKTSESQKQGKKGSIFTQDVDHFFIAFDQAKEVKNKAAKKVLYEKLYFDRASVGMIDYVSMKVSGIDSYIEHVETNRAYYEDVRLATNQLKTLIPDAQKAMQKMKQYYPEAVDSDIYFIVGMHTSAGTASNNGILLGADFIASSKNNIKNLKAWTYPYITDATEKVWVVVHEYVHVLQNTHHADVLGNALVEGGADFLANLLYAPPKQASEYMRFGTANEAMVKAKFIEQMNSTDISLWTGNNGQSLPDNWVPDLGYFIGHQIAQAYYQQAKDKSQAIKDLLELKEPKAILDASGYLKSESVNK